MKRFLIFFMMLCMLTCVLFGCSAAQPQVVATTLPVYEFTVALCDGTGISVGKLISENVSCLHDYTLQVSQMRMMEAAEIVVISGAGLEDFLEDALTSGKRIIDSSAGCHVHDSKHHAHSDEHHHEADPHIWLAPENAKLMAQNISSGLSSTYPHHAERINTNLTVLLEQLDALQAYGEETLSTLTCRELVTFHDGFGYFAESFDLTILEAIEEESGSEASAQELKELIILVNERKLPAIFTEINGSVSAADIISVETGAKVFQLSMVMSGSSYFESMYHNIDTVKEALE